MRNVLKQTLFRALEWGGMNALARLQRRDSLVVLNYHGVLDGNFRSADSNIYCNTVSVEEFDAHLDFLTRHYHPVRASDVEAWVSGQRDLPPRAVLLTFDDGLRNNLTHAAPLLKHHGVPAILFVATSYIGASRILWPQELYELALNWPGGEMPGPDRRSALALDGDRKARAGSIVALAKKLASAAIVPWLADLRRQAPLPRDLAASPVYAFLSWDEVRQLPAYGFEIGSHTVTHPILSRCSGQDQRRELEDSKREIEDRLGAVCPSFCYPNGGIEDWTRETAEAVKAAGYRAAYALSDRIQGPRGVQAYAIDRLAVPGGASQPAFRARVSGNIQVLRRLLG